MSTLGGGALGTNDPGGIERARARAGFDALAKGKYQILHNPQHDESKSDQGGDEGAGHAPQDHAKDTGAGFWRISHGEDANIGRIDAGEFRHFAAARLE